MIRVRDSFPKSSYLPIISTLHDSETDLCDIADFNAPRTSQGFDENVPLVAQRSSKAADIFPKKDDENTRPNIEPIVKISPPTPLKKISKSNAVTIAKIDAEEQHVIVENKCTIKKVDSCKESESLDVPFKNSIMPYDGSGDGKVYSRKTCPFHKHEPAIKIFDDDIEKYLRDDPRTSVSSNQKLIKLPLLQSTSNKYDKIKSKIFPAKNQKIKEITSPRKKLEYYPDNVIDLTANEIAKIELKEDNILDKQRNLRSDSLASDFKFSLSKKSRKEERNAKDIKTASSFSKSFQPQNKIKTSSDKLITKCPKLQKYSNIPKIRESFIDESK